MRPTEFDSHTHTQVDGERERGGGGVRVGGMVTKVIGGGGTKIL